MTKKSSYQVTIDTGYAGPEGSTYVVTFSTEKEAIACKNENTRYGRFAQIKMIEVSK